MNSAVRELISRVECIGWSFDGYDGQGHVVMVHVSGKRHSIPATPSEYRSIPNCLAQLERIAGRKVPRANAGRYKRGLGQGSDAEVEASRRKHAETWDEKCAERERQRAEAHRREAEIEAIKAAERRRREIEDLMR